MQNSNLFTLNWRDFINGFVMAVLAPVVVTIQQSIVAGSLTFNWTLIGVTALGGALGYIIKNFFTPEKKA
jgi:hypothetical protein